MIEKQKNSSSDSQLSDPPLGREEHFRILTELIADFAYVVRVETDGTLVPQWVSEAITRVTGYTVGEISSYGVKSIVLPDDWPVVRDYIKIVLSGQATNIESRIVTKSGELRWLRNSARPVRDDAKGRVTSIYGAAQDVTERRQAEDDRRRMEEALRESEARFKLAAGASGVTLFEQDLKLQYVWVYPQRPEFPEGNIGKSDEELMPAEDAEVLTRIKRQVIETGSGIRHEIRASLPAEVRWYDLTVEPKRTAAGEIIGIAGLALDVTERKRAEQERRQVERDYMDFAENAAVGLHWVAADGSILWANQAELDLLGYTREEYIGRHIADFHADDEVIADILHRLSNKQTLRNYEARLRHKDGSTRHVLITSNVRWDQERFFHTRCFTLDITEAKRLEKEREELLEREKAARREAEHAHQLSAELLRRAQAAREEAEAANRMKDDFLATVSHELRSPLNAILGWAGVLNQAQVDPRTAAQAAETIQRNAKAQAQLIDDLLDISRIITGKMRLDVQPVELPVVLQAAVDAIRPAAEGKDIRLQMILDPGAGPVSGDPGRLQQIIWNLLSNAVKFTPKSGKVQVQLERVNSHVEITVSDSGKGISADFLPYVFDRFRQADSSFTRVHGGLGLGLSIVRQLVELHGGTVEAQSDGEDKGATFVVRLPLAISKDVARYRTGALVPQEAAAIADKLDCPPRLEGLTIVIVDDERDARELLLTILQECGAEVRAAGSAAKGLRR